MASKPVRPERRTGARCPACGATGIKQETTIKGRSVVIAWRCETCKADWLERRRTSQS